MRKKILEYLFCEAIFLLYCNSLTNADGDEKSRQTFVIRYKDGEQTIPVTVVLDYKKQTEYVINMNPRTPAKSVTLYDFKQRTIAYKDLTNRECFLGRLTHETLSEESSALQHVKSPVESEPKLRSLDPGRPALTPTEIRNIAGQKTAVFCRKMNTWLLMPEKVHGISKRDADEYEERTYQHHGYHTVQYSHYGRETRRRYRNPNRLNNSSHRSQTRQSAAEIENKQSEIPALSASSGDHHLNYPSSNGLRQYDDIVNVSENRILQSNNNHDPRNSLKDGNPFSLKHNTNHEDEKKIHHNQEGLTKSTTLNPSDSNKNRFNYKIKHPSFQAEFSSAFRIPIDSQPIRNGIENPNARKNDDTSNLNHDKPLQTSALQHSSNEGSVVSRTLEENVHSRTERATSTTDVPTAPQAQEINHPNLHPSLAHLLPVYKPLSHEFDSDYSNGHESRTVFQENNQKNIESEFNPLSPSSAEQNKHIFFNHSDSHNISFDSDVSTNVLEIPRITKEFENIKSHEKYDPAPQSENSTKVFQSHILPDVYSPASQVRPANIPYQHANGNLLTENAPPVHYPYFPNFDHNVHLEESISYIPPSEISTTTTEPILLTTPDYFDTRRLTNNLPSSPRHTTYQTAEEANSFQIVPHHPSSQHVRLVPPENGYQKYPILKSDNTLNNENLIAIAQNSTVTTEFPLTPTGYKSNANHRSDIASEDKERRLLSSGLSRTGLGRVPSTVPNETSSEYVSSYQIRYQNAFRDFKPEEIVIDIENIPTHPPPPVTSSFHQRTLTTIQPTIRTLSIERVGSHTAMRSEQNSGTTWRTFIPTTKQPRRRITGRTRRPVQQQPSFLVQKNNNHQFIKSPNQMNQIHRNGLFIQHPNRNHVRYSGPPNPPLNAQIPAHLNQPQHFNQFNNLPPGISVHPRHPQAPYADMVHSNRPPTMPFLGDNPAVIKPHRQRHHRKKDRLANSCCRLRGKPNDLQTCCRNGGPCCSRAHSRIQSPGSSCCSSKTLGQGNPANQIHPSPRTTNHLQQPRRPVNEIHPSHRTANQIHPSLRTTNQIRPSLRTTEQIQAPLRTANKIQPPIRTVNRVQPALRTSFHSQTPARSEVRGKDRCQKEKMCRTLYESTQKVMVCRNALIEGC